MPAINAAARLPAINAAARLRPLLLAATAATSADDRLLPEVRDYSGAATALFNNMRTPASLLTGILLGATFSLAASPSDGWLLRVVKRAHMLLGLVSSGATLVAIVACTVAINKLAEIRTPPTAGVRRLLASDDDLELAWLAANVNFSTGLVGLVGLTGVRGFLALHASGGLLWGGACACVAAAVALLMTSLINIAIAKGGGLVGEPCTLLGLQLRYAALLLRRASRAPLMALSLLCTLSAVVLAALALGQV